MLGKWVAALPVALPTHAQPPSDTKPLLHCLLHAMPSIARLQGYCTGDPAARLRGLSQLWVVSAFSVLGMILVWAAELLLLPAGKQ